MIRGLKENCQTVFLRNVNRSESDIASISHSSRELIWIEVGNHAFRPYRQNVCNEASRHFTAYIRELLESTRTLSMPCLPCVR